MMSKLVYFKYYFIVIYLLCNFNQVIAQAQMQFDTTTINLGQMYSGEKKSVTFKFKNIGNKPLLIYDIKTTCGCTQPKWPRHEIAPNDTGSVGITFDSEGKMGYQAKGINLQTNCPESEIGLVILSEILLKPGDIVIDSINYKPLVLEHYLSNFLILVPKNSVLNTYFEKMQYPFNDHTLMLFLNFVINKETKLERYQQFNFDNRVDQLVINFIIDENRQKSLPYILDVFTNKRVAKKYIKSFMSSQVK